MEFSISIFNDERWKKKIETRTYTTHKLATTQANNTQTHTQTQTKINTNCHRWCRGTLVRCVPSTEREALNAGWGCPGPQPYNPKTRGLGVCSRMVHELGLPPQINVVHATTLGSAPAHRSLAGVAGRGRTHTCPLRAVAVATLGVRAGRTRWRSSGGSAGWWAAGTPPSQTWGQGAPTRGSSEPCPAIGWPIDQETVD